MEHAEDPRADQLALEIADLADVLVSLLRKAHARVHGDPDVVKMSQLETFVARYVQKFPGSTASGIASLMGIRQSNISSAIRTLEQKGLIDRRQDTRDQRIVRLHLTPRADATLLRIQAIWIQMLRPHIDRLPPIGDIVESLTHLDAAVSAAAEVSHPSRPASETQPLRSPVEPADGMG